MTGVGPLRFFLRRYYSNDLAATTLYSALGNSLDDVVVWPSMMNVYTPTAELFL
jgi:hypothetical protein